MLTDDRRSAALSALVLTLHRDSPAWPAADFQDRACELLADLLPFDAAVWGSENPATLQPFALHPYRVADRLWADYLTYGAGADPVLAAVRAAPQTAVALDLTEQAATEPAADGADPCVLRALGVTAALGIAQLEPLSQQRAYLCLWRYRGSPPFDDTDQRVLQFLMPHLTETVRESRLSNASTHGHAPATERSHAVSDTAGVLQHVDDRCQVLLRLEWPHWQGSSLPEVLLPLMQADGDQTYVGRRIAVRIAAHNNTVLLAVRLRGAQDRLSARQRDIAELYASGSTGPEIALQLGLSASTVNNHLGAVFKKLQVGSKLELVRVLQPGN